MDEWLEQFWGDVLSEEPNRILDAWGRIELEEQLAVIEHLWKMATEDDWSGFQRVAARAALVALGEAPEDAAPDETEI